MTATANPTATTMFEGGGEVPPTAPLVGDGGTNINDGRHHSGYPPDACPDAATTAPITANSALNIGSVIWLEPPLAVEHDAAAPDALPTPPTDSSAPDMMVAIPTEHRHTDTMPAAPTHYPRP
ncbi:hypothetical protein FB451DRAFT_1397572 [Mycena latifolia]|nr:hypothetical protein FB451DRAFT_1397572 [Mycena latifolia]